MSEEQFETDCSAVILSGGLNSRMGGRNKAFLTIEGKTILDRILETLTPMFDEVLLVTRDPGIYSGQPLRIVSDIYQNRSSLTGIHAGLTHSKAAYAFVVPCDAPFLNPSLVRCLLSEIDGRVDAIVPVDGRKYQPLCAIYSKRCLPFIEAQLDHGDFKIINFFDQILLKAVPVEGLQRYDARLDSFFNVNTPEALEASRALMSAGSSGPSRPGNRKDHE